MRKSALLVATFTTMSLLLGGCASSLTGDSYSRDEARRVQTVRMGTIESLRPVKIEGTKTPIGGGAGAIVVRRAQGPACAVGVLMTGFQHVFRTHPLVELFVREIAQLQRRFP